MKEESWAKQNIVDIDVTAEWYLNAIKSAQEEIDLFISVFENKSENNLKFSIKARFQDQEDIEHLWLTPASFENDNFSAIVDNIPGKLSNIKYKDLVRIHKTEIEDWIIVESKTKFFGNFIAKGLKKQAK